MNPNQQNYNSNSQDPMWQQQIYQQQWNQFGYYNQYQQPPQQQQQAFQFTQNYTQPPPPPPTAAQPSISNNSNIPQKDSWNQQNNTGANRNNNNNFQGGSNWKSEANTRQNWTRGGKSRGAGNSNRGGNRSFNDGNRNFNHETITHTAPPPRIEERFKHTREPPPSIEVFAQPSTSQSEQSMEAEDAAFMKHFEGWESEFEKWRNENKNHPDKNQYAMYENQFLEVRSKLLERRNEMMRRRQKSNPTKTIEQRKFESQWMAGEKSSNQSSNYNEQKTPSASITVQVPPSNVSLSDSAVAPLLFGSSSLAQDRDFKNDSFDTDTFDSFNEESSNSGLRDKVFNRNASIPGLDTTVNDNNDQVEEDTDVIVLDNNDDNAMPPIEHYEEKKFELVLPNFKSKIERKIINIEDILDEPGRSTRSNRNLVIIRGASGSGKSYLARLIQKKEYENGNDRCQIIEGRNRIFDVIFEEILAIVKEGYINFIIIILQKATSSQMSKITGAAFKLGFFQSFSIEIHQKLEVCLKNNVNRCSVSEIRSAIEDLEQNPTPLRTPILDATSLLQPKPKETNPQTSDNKSLDLVSLANLLNDQNVMNIVQKMSSNETNPQSSVNSYNTSQHNFFERNNQQRNFNNMPQTTSNAKEDAENCPELKPKKVIQYGHEHMPTFEEQLLEFKIFRTIDYKHHTRPELQELKRTVDIDKIIEKRKAVAQRKKILEYLRAAERPEDTVSNPLYPKNWEVIPRDRPPRRNKRRKIKTAKIKRVLMQKQMSNDKPSMKMDLEEISSEEDSSDDDMGPPAKVMKVAEKSDFFEMKNLTQQTFPIFKDEYASVSPKSTPDFNHFGHRNCMDIREILWLPGRRNRSPKILIILRGAAGSGKSHLVQLIKRKESEMGKASDIRILSIDDYFLTDEDDDEKSVVSPKEIEKYLEEMLKHLKKTIFDGHHPFIIIDAENCNLTYYEKFHQLGSSQGFSVFAIELFQSLEICTKQCCRNVAPNQINESIKMLSSNRIPSFHTLLIPSALYAEYKCFMNPNLADSQNDDSLQTDESIPSFNWHNRMTKDLCDLLEGQIRFQRPPHIAFLLRGPDTYGKNQLASMIIGKEKEMRNSSVTFMNVEDFFVSKSSGKYEFSARLVDESMRNLTRQLRDITRAKSVKLIIINVETGDFNHYTQVYELMSSYGYKCYTIELYRDAEKCAENDPYERSSTDFETIIDEFKLNPTPTNHELLNAARFYKRNLPTEVETLRKKKDNSQQQQEKSAESSVNESKQENAALSIQKVKKFDRNLRTFDSLQEEYEALLSRRMMIDGKFIVKNTLPPSKLPEFNWYNQEHIVDIRELLDSKNRADKIAVFIRGAPGSGKTFLAHLIERKEFENGNSRENVTVLSVDKYFESDCYKEVETLKYEKYIECNKDESKMNDYMEDLSHELENLVHYDVIENNKSLIIIDGDFCELNYYHRMWNIAVNGGGYVGYTIELNQDDDICLKYNDHGWSKDYVLSKNKQMQEIPIPDTHKLLDPEHLYGDYKYEFNPKGDIFTLTVNLEDISDESDSDDATSKLTASKWDTNDFEKYERMDGTKNKVFHHVSMDNYLKLEDEWTMRPSTSGKKRVRWADIEEKKAQEREREIGFIVGQTDWSRIMNDTDGRSALEKTKYIEPRRKN